MPSVAIFDYRVERSNAIGGCHLRMLTALCDEIDFTVYSVGFDNPRSDRIRWVRIPAVSRPLALLFLTYHALAPLYYLVDRLRGRRYDLIQYVESNFSFGDISYSHFCHRFYLRRHWQSGTANTVRGFMRWLDHKVHALVEPLVYRTARKIVVPSAGLARELASEYPAAASKILVLRNPIDVDRMARPEEFDRAAFRQQYGIAETDFLFVLVALGHFERKGLPLVIEALGTLKNPSLKLIVVGGTPGATAPYREAAERLGVGSQVQFAGPQRDVRPFLWAADAMVSPSAYETFSLAAHEAAAAALPGILTAVNGVDEFLRDGKNGILVERNVASIAAGIARFASLSAEERAAMAAHARLDVRQCDTPSFVGNWRRFYEAELLG